MKSKSRRWWGTFLVKFLPVICVGVFLASLFLNVSWGRLTAVSPVDGARQSWLLNNTMGSISIRKRSFSAADVAASVGKTGYSAAAVTQFDAHAAMPDSRFMSWIPVVNSRPQFWIVLVPLWPFLLASMIAPAIHVFCNGRKRRYRRKKNLCLKCGYPRQGLEPDANCPECGHPRR